MRAPALAFSLLWLASACGPAIPQEDLPDEPIAFIRQKASEGILGLREIGDAFRFENPDDESTYEARLKTTLALLSPRTGDILDVPDAGLGSVPLDWSDDGLNLLIAKIDEGSHGIRLYSWRRITGAWNEIPNANVSVGASFGAGEVFLAWSSPMRISEGLQHALFVFTNQDRARGLMLTQNAVNPDVSVDGTKIVYARPSDRARRDGWIMVIDAAGGEPRAITRGAYPRFSRDGNWISFVRIRNADADVWLMRSDGSARRKITSSSFDETFPSPSPNGRYVVYASSRGAEEEDGADNQLYLTRTVDGVEVQLTHGGQNGRPVW